MNEIEKYVNNAEQLSEEWVKADEKGHGYVFLATNTHIVGNEKEMHYSEGDADYIRVNGDRLALSLALSKMLEKHDDLAMIVLGAVKVVMRHAETTTLEGLLQAIVNNNTKKNDCIQN